jgi:hypothetical protein
VLTGQSLQLRTETRPGRRRPVRLVLWLTTAVAAIAVMCPGTAIAGAVYEPEPPASNVAPPVATATGTRLAFGFGGERLLYPSCVRSEGRRRCRQAGIRPFDERPTSRTVPCCHRVSVGGQLTDRNGHPLSGQTVEVVETFARGSLSRSRTTEITTDGRGFFRAWLPPGPSRTVSASFLGTASHAASSGRHLRLRVRAAVAMTASTSRVRVGGAPVVFRGRVAHPEARIPPTGIFVELEFRLPGMAWQPFRILQTRSGHFRYPYRFEDDDSAGVRFLFRAFVPATGNWSFAPAASRPQGVTG